MIPARGPQTTVNFVIKQELYAHKVCKCTATLAADVWPRQQPFCYMGGKRERDGDAEPRTPVYHSF